jgi:hypothetical protein
MFINASWIFFRAKSWDDAIKVLKGMISNPVLSFSWNILHGIGGDVFTVLWLGIVFIATIFFKNTNTINKDHITVITTFIVSFIFIISIYHLADVSEFLYFNF